VNLKLIEEVFTVSFSFQKYRHLIRRKTGPKSIISGEEIFGPPISFASKVAQPAKQATA